MLAVSLVCDQCFSAEVDAAPSSSLETFCHWILKKGLCGDIGYHAYLCRKGGWVFLLSYLGVECSVLIEVCLGHLAASYINFSPTRRASSSVCVVFICFLLNNIWYLPVAASYVSAHTETHPWSSEGQDL